MAFKGWKKKAADFILAVTEPFRVKLELIEKNGSQRLQALEENVRHNNELLLQQQNLRRRLQELEENTRNNNEALLQQQELWQAVRSLEENIRNNNEALLQQQKLWQAVRSLEENIRNNNETLLQQQELWQAVRLLEENTRNNNTTLHCLSEKDRDHQQRVKLLEENQRNYNVELDKLKTAQNMQIIDAKIEAIKQKLKRAALLPVQSQEQPPQKTDPEAAALNNPYGDIDYFNFENHFRGSEESIKKRQQIYLPYFQDCKHVIDLGCGRGEFLELLREHHIPAIGVDFYDEFVLYTKNKGLTAVESDAVAYLEQCGNDIDGIFAGQLVEHLSVGQIVALCRNAYDRLKEGSYLIMETPNPTSLSIYTHAFYMDPSHHKPVHPLTLKYFAQQAGFGDVQILFTEESRLDEQIPPLQGKQIENVDAFNESMQRVAEYLFGSQDYAVIARK